MIESFAHKQARRLAQKLLAEAEEHEPRITADLQKIASEISAEIVGLENKFKSEESLIRKLVGRSNINSEIVQEVADETNDVLRYTFILSFDSYAEDFTKATENIQKLGYRVLKERIWNAWQTTGKRFDKGYRGINITVTSSQKQMFELQFHTAESFDLKTKTHGLYKKLRNEKISKQSQKKIIEILRKTAAHVKIPKGV